MSTDVLKEKLQEIQADIRSGKKARISHFLKQVPKEKRVDYLRSILRCHLNYRLEAGKELSPDHYARFGKKAIEIAAEEILDLSRTESAVNDHTIELPESRQSEAREKTNNPSPPTPSIANDPVDTLDSGSAPPSNVPEARELKSIDRYRIDRILGMGGFGCVHLGFDEKLQRSVAIKVPHARFVVDSEYFGNFLKEARTVANLDHPNIVPVHDVGSTDQHPFYVVSKFIEGKDLSDVIKERRLSFAESTSLIAKIAEALHHAHKQGIVHRDIKPGNILVGDDGTPYIVDFGLAYCDQDPLEQGRRVIGTPAYMSPEQAGGEGHRVNGQSDIFSLGVILYELLTERRPFHGNDITEVLSQIRRIEPRPLRQYDESIPLELERICLKAISKKAKNRYSTAFDMSEDLRFCMDATPGEHSQASISANRPPSLLKSSLSKSVSQHSDSQSASVAIEANEISIVPKGLRSFDIHDAEFFLQLLPGPRDRMGLPDSVRFWKTKLEELNRADTFSVGLIYGPSGCGKSSFIKSGLLPNLNDSVVSVYVESTPDETESRLSNGIHRLFPDAVDSSSSLSEAIASLRRGAGLQSGRKLILILDQFEQWLHSRPNIADTELVRAIRHCDGERVQCIVAVRDDFWMGATRFMRELEIRQEEGSNAAAVDLFPARHARDVLLAFGQAFGALPDSPLQLTDEQNRFLDLAIEELQEDEKVICVRLALFAEMMKNRQWNSEALASVGGVEGLRVNFLEETFVKTSAPPRNRYHQKAVRNVLKGLVPETGTDIKGEMKSWNQLKQLSGYQNSDDSFEELMQILDHETRLVTPTDPAGSHSDSLAEPDMKYYQLAHDYLVPSIQQWLALKQRETKQGRAELMLAERSSLWKSKPENRQLPTMGEYLGIRRHVKNDRWSADQRGMMKQASKYYGVRAAVATLALMLIGASSWFIWQRNIEARNQEAASDMVDLLVNAKTAKASEIISSMRGFDKWTQPIMASKVAKNGIGPTEELHLRLGLSKNDPEQADALLKRLVNATPEEAGAILTALRPYAGAIKENIWKLTESENALLPAVSLLAEFDSESQEKWNGIANGITELLIAEPVDDAVQWSRFLKATDEYLTIPLRRIYLMDDQSRNSRDIDRARDLLGLNAEGDWGRVAELQMIAKRGDFTKLFSQFSRQNQKAEELLKIELDKANTQNELNVRRAANAAVAALKLGMSDLFLAQVRRPGMPDIRAFITHAARDAEVSPDSILDLIRNQNDSVALVTMLQILSTYPGEEISQNIITEVSNIFSQNSDPGVHASARWALSKWRQSETVAALENQSATVSVDERRNWFVTKNNAHRMSVIDGPIEFNIGSPISEKDRQEDETLGVMKIDRSFAIASTETTMGQFKSFREFENDYVAKDLASTPNHPRIGLDWYQAAQYCRWLSEKEGIEESQMCFPPVNQIKPGMKLDPDMLSKTGYRLPTEAEWEYACRAGTDSSRFFGNDGSLAHFYVHGIFNSRETTHPVGKLMPNDLGVHDSYGNANEWCLQAFKPYSSYGGIDKLLVPAVSNKTKRVVRGACFKDRTANLRSAIRLNFSPGLRAESFGFRIARTMPKEN